VKIFTYRFTYKKPFWRQKDTKSYVKVHKGTFIELSDSHKISQEKRNFKISDVLITAWSRVQVLAGHHTVRTRTRFFMKKGLGTFLSIGSSAEGLLGTVNEQRQGITMIVVSCLLLCGIKFALCELGRPPIWRVWE